MYCKKCGTEQKPGQKFCPKCGTKQYSEDVVDQPKSKKWLWAAVCIVFLVLVGSMAFHFTSGKSESTTAGLQRSDSTMVSAADIDTLAAVDFIKDMYKDIFENKNFDKESLPQLRKYLSPSVAEKLKMESPYDGFEGDSSYVVDFFCDGSLSYERPDYGDKVVSRTIKPENDGWFLVTNIWDIIKDPVKVLLQVKSIDGVFKVVDIKSCDQDDSSTPSDTNDNPSFVGRIFKGSGNGAGLFTEMTITFQDNNQCLCVSDWYQTYTEPKSIKGTYEVKGNQVIVRCKNGDIDHIFEFDIKSNGRVIEFNHSDPDEEGTMGNDFMSLELK